MHRAEWRGTPVAVKKLARNRITPEALRAFTAECELMLSLRHPHIVQARAPPPAYARPRAPLCRA